MERFSETQERRSSDDDFDVNSPKQKKSRISGTDREKTKKDFELRAEKFKLKRESIRYGKEKARSFTKPRGNAYTTISAASECNVAVSWKTYVKTLIQSKHVQRNLNTSMNIFDCIPKQPQEVFYK